MEADDVNRDKQQIQRQPLQMLSKLAVGVETVHRSIGRAWEASEVSRVAGRGARSEAESLGP